MAASRIRSLFAATLLVATSVTACSDPLSPSDLAGLYVLEDPAALVSPDFRVIADTIFLNADGSGSKRTHWEIFDPQHGQTQFMQNEAFFNFELDGPWVVLRPACVGCIDLVGYSDIKFLLAGGGLTREPDGTYLRR